MSQIIGEIGRWQYINITIVFLIGIPGLGHIYSSAFVAAKADFWCSDDYDGDPADYLKANISLNKAACQKACPGGYAFDRSFWHSTLR